jgi:hypothetical protein
VFLSFSPVSTPIARPWTNPAVLVIEIASLLAKDDIGRNCLHYGAPYGLRVIRESFLEPDLVRDRSYTPH